jgi:hypothetical protein
MTGPWPYSDAAEHDPLTALRIPVIPTPHPQHRYAVALMLSDTGLYGPTARPDDAETQMIVSYLGFRLAFYAPDRLPAQPLDTDAGTSTAVLVKRGPGHWCWRNATWATGPLLMPPPGDPPLTLPALLDRINVGSRRWADWKTARPAVFPAEPQP